MNIQPRAWQVEAYNAWAQNAFRGSFAVVTGAGKTVFALYCGEMATKELEIRQIVVIVPTEALLFQWRAAVSKVLQVPLDSIGQVGAGRIRKLDARIVIALSRSWRRLLKDMPDVKERLLVVDEMHHVGTRQLSNSLNLPSAYSIGLSATPERSFDDNMTELVYPKIGPLVFEYGYRRALEEGVIVPFSLTCIKVPSSAEEDQALRRVNRALAAAIRSHDQAKIQRQMIRRAQVSNQVRSRRLSIVPLFEHLGLRRGLVFADTIDSAEEIAELLRQSGRRAQTYHSRLTGSTRMMRVATYYGGMDDVLVACAALDEGFDVPDTEFALMSASAASQRRRIQRMGRALRPARGKESAQVIALYVTDSEENELRADADQYSGIANTEWLEVSAHAAAH